MRFLLVIHKDVTESEADKAINILADVYKISSGAPYDRFRELQAYPPLLHSDTHFTPLKGTGRTLRLQRAEKVRKERATLGKS